VTVTVPVHTGADVGRRLALRILKDAGFTVDDYRDCGDPFPAAFGANRRNRRV